MKPLNRPMFRYGGPIKEGVMSGIREPRQGYANGPGLVIRNDPNKMGVAKALKNAEAFMNVGKTYNQNLNNQAAVLPVNKIKKPVYNEMDLATIGGYGEIEGPSIEYDKIPKYIADVDGDGIRDINPEYTKNKSFLNDIFGGPFVRRNTNKKLDPQIKTGVEGREFTGMEEQIVGDPRKNLPDKLNQDATKSAEELKKERIQKYRDIMDIKGMNKTAAYNSLIAASQLINQEGDFKGSLKDGSLINKIIGAANKQFEKPRATKDAINTLIAKAEIEKDINLSKGNSSTQQIKALADASGRSEQYVANAKLGIANTPGEAKQQLVKLKKTPITSDDVTSTVIQFAEENGIQFKKQFTTEQKSDLVGKGKKYSTVVELIDAIKLNPNGADDGLYVVGTSIVEVKNGIPKLKG